MTNDSVPRILNTALCAEVGVGGAWEGCGLPPVLGRSGMPAQHAQKPASSSPRLGEVTPQGVVDLGPGTLHIEFPFTPAPGG